MITVSAIVSLRNLPMSAEFGLTSIFYFGVSALIFFIPVAFVTAELAAGWPKAGGTYVWVSEAFGKKTGFYALWLAWMGIIAWYPLILSFTAAMLAHLLAPLYPGLETSKLFYFTVMLVVFWGATLLNFLGIKTSSGISTLGVLSGTVIPGALIIGLGVWWFLTDQPSYITFSWQALIPEWRLESMVLFSGILLGLVGVEVAAYHIQDANHPQKDYPRAIGLAVLLILLISILGTLAIAMVVPQKELSLISGLIQAFSIFFERFQMGWAVPIVALLALVGSLASMNTWIVGPAKGLLETAQAGFLPKWLAKVNARGAPTGLLLFQAIVGSILSLVFLWMDTHSAAYWILTALSAQFAMVQYGFIFLAAFRLRYTQPKTVRAYRVPGGKWGMGFVTLIGVLACLFGFLVVFIPPTQLAMDKQVVGMWLLPLGFVLLSLIPLFFSVQKKAN